MVRILQMTKMPVAVRQTGNSRNGKVQSGNSRNGKVQSGNVHNGKSGRKSSKRR